VPDDVLPEIPAIGAKGESEHPRDSHEVFGFQVRNFSGVRLRPIFRVCAMVYYMGFSMIRVAHIHERNAIVPQKFPHKAEDLHHPGNVLGGGFFVPHLIHLGWIILV
jgi:hypothetical protein